MLLPDRQAGLAICCILLAGPLALADDAEAEKVLGEIKASWKLPAFDRSKGGDPNYVRAYQDQLRASLNRRVDLVGRFYRISPEHPAASDLMMKRWAAMMSLPLIEDRKDELVAELDAAAADEGNALRVEAAYLKATLNLPAARTDGLDAALGPIETFIALAPRKDERGARLLSLLASTRNIPPDRKSLLIERIFADYPDSQTAQSIKASMRRPERIGKPFELTFQDAIGGERISLREDLKGKVVVVDFWATWCGPCVAEIPGIKRLYSEYKDKGVAFIGVSLDPPDENGLKALMAFVKENRVGWPQFHGEAASEFVRSWDVTLIPTVFVIDSRGLLHTTEGRGQLDSLLPELLR